MHKLGEGTKQEEKKTITYDYNKKNNYNSPEFACNRFFRVLKLSNYSHDALYAFAGPNDRDYREVSAAAGQRVVLRPPSSQFF